MKLESFRYTKNEGWSVAKLPDLDSKNTLVLVFFAPEFSHDAKPIQELAQHYPQSIMVGCSSAGEIFDSHIYDHSLSVAVIQFDRTNIKAEIREVSKNKDSYVAGKEIIEKLNKPNLQGIFVLSDGLHVNGSELVNGLNSLKLDGLVITGGLAGDGEAFKSTWSIFNGEIHTDKIIAIGFYGTHIHIGHGSRGGWDIFGPERHVTRSKGNILYELDGKPALALYKEYLGERANGLPATGLLFPLAIRESVSDERQLVRTILAVDEEAQSLTFAGDIPKGYLAQLMHANFDRIISSASEAGEIATNSMFQEQGMQRELPVLSIAISCVGRRLLLGERTEEETESLLETLPSTVKQIGFYSYGEISPYATGECNLHNQTMTITTFYEDEAR